MAAFREAEARGLDLHRELPALVQGRTVGSADDVAALLYGRLTKRISSSGSHPQQRIVGLFPTVTGVADSDTKQALQDRSTLIEQRARSLALFAIEHRQPWTLRMGRPPADPTQRENWLRQLDAIAAYRERWQINGEAFLGTEPRSHEQTAHQQFVQLAASSALTISRPPDVARDVSEPATVIEPMSR